MSAGASTLARAVARQVALDLEDVSGSGDSGRILARDLAGALRAAGVADPPASPLAREVARQVGLAARPGEGSGTGGRLLAGDVLPGPSRTATAEVITRCLADPLIGFVEALNGERRTELPITVTDVLVKMTAVALRGRPLPHTAQVGQAPPGLATVAVAVILDAGHGLVAPAVRSADAGSIAEIAAEIRELEERARAGGLQSGNAHGADIAVRGPEVEAAGRPPPSPAPATLTIAAPTREPVAEGDEAGGASVLTLTLSADRGPVDGNRLDGYLAELQGLIEEPRRLLL